MDSVSRISSLLETTRDLTIEAAQSSGLARNLGGRSSRELSFTQIKKLLESRHDREILDGLRKVISMIYQSKPGLPYFSAVVKNVASPNVEIKKLVYIYLLHYAESEPDLALLSINTIQKSLSDQKPQVRAMALRVMSGIRVPVISQIVSLAIKKGCGDLSPLVRKAAALAIPKCYRLDPNTLPQLVQYLSSLLGDKQYYVIGSAVASFLEVCPDRIDLVHQHYRSLVRKLVDMDDWGQLALIGLLTPYCRRCFPRPPAETRQVLQRGQETEGPHPSATTLDRDLELLLTACKSLLQSRNSAVVVAVARCYVHLAPLEYLQLAVGPLVALLRSSPDLLQVVLYNIVSMCLLQPELFGKYASHFFLRATDTRETCRLKLEILTLVFPSCDSSTKEVILIELEHFTKASDPDLVRESVKAIGRCAQKDPKTSPRCLNLLLKQAKRTDSHLVSEALTVIRHLIQQDPSSSRATVIRLAKDLDVQTNPDARASIIWLVGEFAGVDEPSEFAPDVLRILAKGFSAEAEAAKLQIVLLAAKVYLHHLNRMTEQKEAHSSDDARSSNAVLVDQDSEPVEQAPPHESFGYDHQAEQAKHPIAVLFEYILLLARYDTSYDLRDRTRFYKALLADPTSTQLASLLLLAPKPVPQVPSPSESRKDFLLGSISLIIGENVGLPAHEKLPDWVAPGDEPDPKLRDEARQAIEPGTSHQISAGDALDAALRAKAGAVAISGSSAKDKTLDDWLAEEDNTSGSEETDEELEAMGKRAEGQSDEEYESDDSESESGSDSDDGE